MSEAAPTLKKPDWLKTPIPGGDTFFEIKKDLRDRKLFTVCEEAKCPNIGTCWATRTATFMILGDTCTRGCKFCHVKTGNPGGWIDVNEPMQVAQSAAQMNLKYVVITMVDRDDLEDGGAAHMQQVVKAVRDLNPGIVVELLVGDFRARGPSIDSVLTQAPDVYAHNLETVRRLTPRVRDARATYDQSLLTLEMAKKRGPKNMFTKSALMLGLGETESEILATLKDMRSAGVEFVTIGQYMRPTKKHLSIKRFAPPEEFSQWEKEAFSLGFLSVASAPLVRSSFKANVFYEQALQRRSEINS